jgi:FK506-binding protein 15
LARSGSIEFRSPLSQEIIVGPKGKGAQLGDTATIKYSIYGETAGQVGNVIDSNVDKDPVKFRVGEASVMPRSVEDLLVGLKKTGKRIIVTSAEISTYKLLNVNVPSNTILLLEVELLKLKKYERTGSISKVQPKLPDFAMPDLNTDNTFNLPNIASDDTTSTPPPTAVEPVTV